MTRAEAAALSWEELEAAGLCDCGGPLKGHPPLAKPLPLSHGRPCSWSALDRGRGWDGRPLPEHTALERARWEARSQRGGRRPMSQQPSIFRGRPFVIRAEHQR